jgi:hypothetical protein
MKRKARKDNDIMPEKRGFKCKYWTARQDKTMSTVTCNLQNLWQSNVLALQGGNKNEILNREKKKLFY